MHIQEFKAIVKASFPQWEDKIENHTEIAEDGDPRVNLRVSGFGAIVRYREGQWVISYVSRPDGAFYSGRAVTLTDAVKSIKEQVDADAGRRGVFAT